MAHITVENGPSFEVEDGTKLVLALEDHGVDILHRCGGNARCTTCRVEILAGQPNPPEEAELEILSKKGHSEGQYRLSCQIRTSGDLTVRPAMTVTTSSMDAGPRPTE
ncbi:2Fe-2S iron-sulfur cluster-binding protein [Ferroacidibacillus organovorans]|uniref:(2Fe-2S)-binding protein n=1 Tax=Ferroacidibacillus organovorans TaxID=1765683 RepID=A0A162SE62_9BACL|nr:2Fe-2S iron-sulfur cluster-binding protein [Ferroacidibacillus organovorans]KYP79745.1 (2Fe-2S)-binding protein [Ferroacidibacillus organovorans]OAG90823.1 (2Fe-2S)-binding protein [Ferroacidibacillus organovorans]OPG15829.1 (2Fe-2S)-binding protein [Ferroacidibacillus organovorans]